MARPDAGVIELLEQHKNTDVDSLKHYGIPGMKWGVRRREGSDGRVVRGKMPVSDDFREAKELAKKRPSQLSNAELKKLNERMQLEQNYSNLTSKKNQQKIKEGREQVKLVIDLVKTGKTLYDLGKPGVSAAREVLKNK